MKDWLEKQSKRINWLAYELICTLSNKPSFFASKRLERCALFIISCSIVIGFVSRNWEKLSTEQMLMIVGTLILNSAWNATQIRKDQKQNSETDATTPPSQP